MARCSCFYANQKTILPALVLGLALAVRGGETVTNSFGFTGQEIYPIDDQISLLHVADLDGDGLNDLIVVNNLRSKINLLYNQTGKTNRAVQPPRKLEINELPPDARFRIDSIPVGRTHLRAGGGRPQRRRPARPRFLRRREGPRPCFTTRAPTAGAIRKRWHIDDGQMDANALATGDLNGDGRTDLVLLGDNGSLYFLPQKADHTLGEPQKIPYSGTPNAVQIADINGDGRNDLLLVDWDSPTPFRFRLQNAAGQLGPEIYFKTQPIRSYCADNLEGNSQPVRRDHRAKFRTRGSLAVHPQAGGAVVRRVPAAASFRSCRCSKTDAAQRGVLWADVNGDGLPGSARGRAGERPALGLFAAAGRLAGRARKHFRRWPASARSRWRIGTATASRKFSC